MTFPRIVHRARRIYWEVTPGVFQATESPDVRPQGVAGYANLAALCALKGDQPPAMVHYQRSFDEVRAERFIDRGDYNARPPVLCRSGDGHAIASRDWSAVTCPACLAACTDITATGAGTLTARPELGPGELLTMANGEKWFHPYGGAAPQKIN